MATTRENLTLLIFFLMPIVKLCQGDVDLGQFALSVCREGHANISWIEPPGSHQYQFVDLYYTRKSDNGKDYLQITVMSWTQSRGWKVTSSPTRFIGRLTALTHSATTQFMLTNVIRIDNGKYELSAVTKDHGTFLGLYNLTVFTEENYFPRLIDDDNTTDISHNDGADDGDDDDTGYVYEWLKPDESPAVGVTMEPKSEKTQLKPQTCFFDGRQTCKVVFTEDDLATVGRVSFHVTYHFPANFTKCTTLDEPPTNLVIVIPPRSFSRVVLTLVVPCVVLVIAVVVVVPIIVHWKQSNKSRLSIKQHWEFVTKCIDGIQNINTLEDLKGVYRANTPQSIIRALIMDYKTNIGNEIKIDELMNERPKKDLASCLKHVLRTADKEWLPKKVQEDISQQDDPTFDVETVRGWFRGSRRGRSTTKRNVLAAVFRHFDWYLTTTSREENQSQIHLVDLSGLATCIAPNFFQRVPDSYAPNLATARWINFIIFVIQNTNEIFPVQDDPGNNADDTDMPLVESARS